VKNLKADDFLEDKGIDFELVEQDNPTLDCDDAARERGVDTDQIVKSLIIEADGEEFHCLVPGDRKLSEKKFGKEYRMVDPERSKEITDQESGTVHPFASDLKHFVDERIFEKERVSFTRGDRLHGVIVEPEEFRKGLELSDFDWERMDLVNVTDEEIEDLKEEGLSEEDAKFVARNARTEFKALNLNFDAERVATGLRKVLREKDSFDVENVSEILERAENETHMQRLSKRLAEEEVLPEEDDGFDLEETVEQVLDDNPEAVEDFNSGRDSAINYLLGQVMSETNGRAEASEAEELLREKLE
jgi:prolyl-tRNA editing enzyme YbaK/EbsC (Cys-tRNA(Pro) deacylase)